MTLSSRRNGRPSASSVSEVSYKSCLGMSWEQRMLFVHLYCRTLTDQSQPSTRPTVITMRLTRPQEAGLMHARLPGLQFFEESEGILSRSQLRTRTHLSKVDEAHCSSFDGKGITSTDIWTGGSDGSKEGTFVWAGGPEAGRSINNNDEKWDEGEPNNGCWFFCDEDCLEFQNDGKWNDEDCGDLRNSVIEYNCPDGKEFGPTACRGMTCH